MLDFKILNYFLFNKIHKNNDFKVNGNLIYDELQFYPNKKIPSGDEICFIS